MTKANHYGTYERLDPLTAKFTKTVTTGSVYW